MLRRHYVFCGVSPGVGLFGKLVGSRLKHKFIGETAFLIRPLKLKGTSTEAVVVCAAHSSGPVWTSQQLPVLAISGVHLRLQIWCVNVIFGAQTDLCMPVC